MADKTLDRRGMRDSGAKSTVYFLRIDLDAEAFEAYDLTASLGPTRSRAERS